MGQLQSSIQIGLEMATGAGMISGASGQPVQLSFPLPKAPDTRIHVHLTIQTTSILLFLTTAMNGDTSTVPLGSFVYALPDRLNPGQTLCTLTSPPWSSQHVLLNSSHGRRRRLSMSGI